MNTQTELVDTLKESKMFRDYRKAYTDATGLPITLRPMQSWQLPLHARRSESPWCALMASRSPTCAACLQMQERLTNSANHRPVTLTCTYGLSETVVPVPLGRNSTAYLQTGQVMLKKPTHASFKRALEQTRRRGVDLDETTARHAFFNTPVITTRKMDGIQGMLSQFAEHLSIKCNEIIVQRNNSEPPLITSAKRYIEEHLAEDVTLASVAKAVNSSVFYFCKLFKRATGLTFTEYLNRRRIEKAKNYLLNPNLRVSEIAYESGFQSLTHFNRMFRKIVGESPTAYRRRLPSG